MLKRLTSDFFLGFLSGVATGCLLFAVITMVVALSWPE